MPDPVEEVVRFRCKQATLWGVLSRPPNGVASTVAVLIVVGGPQYRVGSHRQFVVLARTLASHGFPTLRFDYRGMGDSEGERQTFEEAGPDVTAAIDALTAACPQAQRVVVWGLCDAASAAMMFATAHPRVAGIVAANPWARSEVSQAATRLKHYYGARLMQREFWAKLGGGGFAWRASLQSLWGNLKAARDERGDSASSPATETFHARMARGLAAFQGRTLLILSGNDLTAKEFLEYTASAPLWKGLLQAPGISRFDIAEADHTFSTRAWLDRVAAETLAWLQRLAQEPSKNT